MTKDITLASDNKIKTIEAFQMLLNQNPEQSDVRVNSQANNAEYVPIFVIERELDSLYNGLWKTSNFRWEVIANEVVGSILLEVFHPTAKTWISREGCASTMILTQKEKPATVEFKIKNTLVKDFPHMKAECLKNAAKSLGVRFGRNLNRGKTEDFQYLSEQTEIISEGQEKALDLLSSSTLSPTEAAKVERKIRRANQTQLGQMIDYLTKKQQ
jgi:hypothetical protein